MAPVQKGVRDADVLNHLVMHASRLSTCASVCEEVRNIMRTRATLMNTAQPMDIGALAKGEGRREGARARRVTGERQGEWQAASGKPTRESE